MKSSASSAPSFPKLRAKDRAKLLELVNAEIALIEGQQAAAEAERQFEAQAGETASHAEEIAHCADGADGLVHWFNTWAWTYDPRLIGTHDPEGQPASPYVRFRLFPKQEAYVRWAYALVLAREPGALEKSRDAGASYLSMGVALWFWLFVPGFKATAGSREAALVDSRDNPDSLFEKLRVMARRLPTWMMPAGFSWRAHDNLNRFTNPDTGAIISGEAGDEMGRGGRSSLYLVDEAAFVPRAARVEAALSGNTDCVLWVSTVNPQDGIGNFFARKRRAMPAAQVFRLHWRDDPRKDEAWAAAKRASLTDDSIWMAEYEIDYTAGSEGMCIPSAWVLAAQQLAQLEPELRRIGPGIAGGDVGGGKAKSITIIRFGPVVLPPAVRQEADTTDTAYWMLDQCREAGCATLNFDAPGIGAGVLSTLSKAEGYPGVTRWPINTGNPPTNRVWPDERQSSDMFGNLKAELWWLARGAFQRTFQHVKALKGEEGGMLHPISDLVALPDDASLATELSVVRWFRNERGKIVIETKAQLKQRTVPSPDYADALVLSFLEPEDDGLFGLEMDQGALHRANPWSVGGTAD